jgi:hypothetical protein
MPDQHDEQRDLERGRQQRQYEIDVLTAQYADEVRSGRQPRIEDYVERHPQYAAELLEFAVYYHTVGFDIEPPYGPADVELSPAAISAQARIRALREAPNVRIVGLVARGLELGLPPPQLAAAVGLTMALLGKLEARVIAVASIPPTLVRRLASALRVAPVTVETFLGAAGPGTAGAFYYADTQPTQQQEPFLDAIQSSELPPAAKQEWADIVRADAGGGA